MKLKLLFQFLIGMVSTRKKEKEEKKMKKLYFVSIPYRYGIYTKEKSIDIANTLYRIRKLWNMKFDGVDND